MESPQLLWIAASISLIAGWRLSLSLFATGLAMKMGVIDLPVHVSGLRHLASDAVLVVAGTALIVETVVDKTAWLDSLWDSGLTFIRPLGGAMLALTVADPASLGAQIGALLLGGSSAYLSHNAKAGARAILNLSPEPFSNIALSVGEDVVSLGLIFLVLKAPVVAPLVAAMLLFGNLLLNAAVRRTLNRLFTPPRKPS